METNTQIDAYLKPREPKQHERRMLSLLREYLPNNPGRVIDIGCARGTFLKMLVEQYPSAQLTGIDISSELISEAKAALPHDKVQLLVSDVMAYSPTEPFDVAIASGILSVFDDFEAALNEWLSWLTSRGKLFVFGCFNSRNIDTIIKFRNNAIGKTAWEGGLTSYSKQTVAAYLSKHGYSFTFERFEIDFDLPKSNDPIRSYTETTTDGRRLLLTGANNVYELWFLVIEKGISG